MKLIDNHFYHVTCLFMFNMGIFLLIFSCSKRLQDHNKRGLYIPVYIVVGIGKWGGEQLLWILSGISWNEDQMLIKLLPKMVSSDMRLSQWYLLWSEKKFSKTWCSSLLFVNFNLFLVTISHFDKETLSTKLI